MKKDSDLTHVVSMVTRGSLPNVNIEISVVGPAFKGLSNRDRTQIIGHIGDRIAAHLRETSDRSQGGVVE
jgi:hypothetical protein